MDSEEVKSHMRPSLLASCQMWTSGGDGNTPVIIDAIEWDKLPSVGAPWELVSLNISII